MTFSNDLERDLANVEAYRAFRDEALAAGMRHFLEVFNPAIDIGLAGEDLALFINDVIVRSLAGLTTAEQPLFLKMPTTARGDGGARLLRSRQPHRRHPRRREGHHPRHLRARLPGGEATARASPCSAARSTSPSSRSTSSALMRRVIEGDVSAEEAVPRLSRRARQGGARAHAARWRRTAQITEAVLKAG